MNVFYFILFGLIILIVYQASSPFKSREMKTYHMGKTFDESKPFLWIHAEGEVNARHWLNFYSRNTTELNQPYLFLTMKSINDKCGDSFNVCLIDDDAFKMIDGWTHDVSAMPNPEKQRYRQLGLAKLLYQYGGLLVPSSFLCLKNLKPFYRENLEKTAFAVYTGKKDKSGDDVASPLFMGCERRSELMAEYVDFLENHNVSDFNFGAHILPFHNGSLTGSKTAQGVDVTLQDLLGTEHVAFHRDTVGVYFPAEELLKRPAFAWFARMSSEQLLRSEMVFMKMLMASY
jgi:hypothetical protein